MSTPSFQNLTTNNLLCPFSLVRLKRQLLKRNTSYALSQLIIGKLIEDGSSNLPRDCSFSRCESIEQRGVSTRLQPFGERERGTQYFIHQFPCYGSVVGRGGVFFLLPLGYVVSAPYPKHYHFMVDSLIRNHLRPYSDIRGRS